VSRELLLQPVALKDFYRHVTTAADHEQGFYTASALHNKVLDSFCASAYFSSK
jgi:hypothetical protein